MSPPRSRLAPRPTGSLHLGNARTFLINWLMLRKAGGTIVLRIEDLDLARSRESLAEQAISDLEWLGLDWDEGPIRQQDRTEEYERALERLRQAGLVYPCVCSRREVAAASAPHAEDEGPRYPGTCSDRFTDPDEARRQSGREPCWRFRVPAGPIRFVDRFRGEIILDPDRRGGDFVVRSCDATFSYQLAVTVDDSAMAISEVLRGDDLIPSTPRQILLHQALGSTPPRFIYLPLVLDGEDRRLAKRRFGTELASLRRAGVSAGKVIRYLAQVSGIPDPGSEVLARDLVDRFQLDQIPREPVRIGSLPWKVHESGMGP
ncbi:MAG: tRNA glutamyl-Q(34) synthetase GluQRS [Planctomycetota bacterium]